ncbi:pistil-specific extensin-like protein [Nicotiana sylvestris]|uniref:Pistil-specific extensin-like protein n=1 Tax=Nicotiana sylvestris TaxID=4096 RepID=A0A1U7WIW7_NICSY|nr:PREDICTED: pistil-specific extensin-like protein [Nicotiana sylvestris]
MKMKAVNFMVAAASLIVVFSNFMNVAQAFEGMDVIHVAGKVLCQDCTQGWNEWVDGAKPIKGSIVSLTCLDERRRVMYYGSDLTDEAGKFDLITNTTCYGKTIKPQNCFLRLVSSPDPVCNIATDFAGGKSGIKLHRPTVIYRDLLKYVLGPFYYTTPMCDEPDTNDDDNLESDDEGKGSNY